MRQYIEIAQNILDNGVWKENRTGVRCLTSLPAQFFCHNMQEGFPLLTTKKMAMKTLAIELEGFIGGITSKRWYKDRGCNIWNEWSNPKEVFLNRMKLGYLYDDKEGEKEVAAATDDLGPIYGFQWRRFGETYDIDDDGVLKGADQLKYVVETLKTNPNDRRMVVSAWNPNQLNRMALPACHFGWGVTHVGGILNLNWVQRSCDLFLGVPFNIASYALLLLILCKESGLKPGYLTGILWDCHIYENHMEQIKEQISRTPYSLPTLEILSTGENGKFNIFDWTYKHYKLNNYNSHPRIQAPVAV